MPFALLLAALAIAAWRADWVGTLGGDRLHRFLGGAVALGLLWAARAEFAHGMVLQLLGTPLLTLMLGPALAIWSATLATAGLALFAGHSIELAVWHALAWGVLPALATDLGRRAVAQWLPAHLFVYILGNGFFVTGFAAAAAQLGALGWLWLTQPAAGGAGFSQGVPFVLLICAGEATLSGMLLTLMVVYLPTWVSTFEDRHYLRKQT